MSEIRYSLENGKYEVVFVETTGRLYALRHGEPWQDLSGNKLVLAMLQELDKFRSRDLCNECDIAGGRHLIGCPRLRKQRRKVT